MSKLEEDSGSRRSMFMVRQFISGAILRGRSGLVVRSGEFGIRCQVWYGFGCLDRIEGAGGCCVVIVVVVVDVDYSRWDVKVRLSRDCWFGSLFGD